MHSVTHYLNFSLILLSKRVFLSLINVMASPVFAGQLVGGQTVPDYVVRQGDCISSIAEKHSLFWQTVWDHANNTELRERRSDPNALYPGDVVYVPDKRKKEESGSTEIRHRFRKKGVPATLRVILEDNDVPIANEPYVLDVDGQIYAGRTGADGLLEVRISPTAKLGKITLGDLVYELDMGAMDPLDENTGAQARLQNLGFYDGELDGVIGSETREAIASFQRAVGLNVTSELDTDTRKKLFDWGDQQHEALTTDSDEDEEDESLDDEEDEEEPSGEEEDPTVGDEDLAAALKELESSSGKEV
jgi:hypothetical protein